MDRKQLINEIFEGMVGMKRAMMSKQFWSDHQHSGMPSQAQMGVLFVIENHGTQSIKQIAELFGMTSSAVTQLVDGLVQLKFLKRSEDVKDRRKIVVEMTKAGQEMMAIAKKSRLAKIEIMFEPLTIEELTQYQTIQQKIVKHLNSTNEQSKRTK